MAVIGSSVGHRMSHSANISLGLHCLSINLTALSPGHIDIVQNAKVHVRLYAILFLLFFLFKTIRELALDIWDFAWIYCECVDGPAPVYMLYCHRLKINARFQTVKSLHTQSCAHNVLLNFPPPVLKRKHHPSDIHTNGFK